MPPVALPEPLLRDSKLHPLVLFSIPSLLAILVVLFARHPIRVAIARVLGSPYLYRGYYSTNSFDAGAHDHQRWMSVVSDNVFLTDLSIPGTHDTMTFDVGDIRFQCQNKSLETQLNSGLRYFDIRGRLVDDEIQVYHATMYTGYSFVDVFTTFFSFLDANPSEALLVRIKDEASPINSTGTYEEAFRRYLLKDPRTASGLQRRLFVPEDPDRWPTLGELRGKIVLLIEFANKEGPYGMPWAGKSMALQDLWIIPSYYHLWLKWRAISQSLDAAAAAPANGTILYVSHLSASVGVLPIAAAAGTKDRKFEGMNDRTAQRLLGEKKKGRTGVVIMDFPGQELIDVVLERNTLWGKQG